MRPRSPPRRLSISPHTPGNRPTSYDVARLAGVSQSAVSRCFSAGASISADTRAKVEQAARTLGYSPNPLARSLITRRSGLVGLVVTDATLRYSPQIVHDLSDALKRANLLALLATLQHEHDLAEALPPMFDYRPEAIISLVTVNAELAAEARAHGIPLILVNRRSPDQNATSICCDHAGGVHDLTTHLIASGHRAIAFIAGPIGAPVSAERQTGFDAAMREAGLAPAAVLSADYSYDGGHAAALALMRGPRSIDALVCANDAMAIGALDACRADLGLDVPGDVSITGFDDIAEGGRPTRGLTTVRAPTAEMARRAVEEVLRLSEGGDVAATPHLIAGTLIARTSTRAT